MIVDEFDPFHCCFGVMFLFVLILHSWVLPPANLDNNTLTLPHTHSFYQKERKTEIITKRGTKTGRERFRQCGPSKHRLA